MQKSDSDVGVAFCFSPDAALVAASLDLDSHVRRVKTSLPSQKHCDKYEAIGLLHGQDAPSLQLVNFSGYDAITLQPSNVPEPKIKILFI